MRDDRGSVEATRGRPNAGLSTQHSSLGYAYAPMKPKKRHASWVATGFVAAATVIACSSSPDTSNGTIEDQQQVADNVSPQTVRIGKRVSVEIDIPANVLPERQPLTVTVRTNVVRKGATAVGSSVEFQPAGLRFNSVVRVRQPLPIPTPLRRYAAFQSLPDSDSWVRRAPGRKLLKSDPMATTEVWELDADTTGLWVFAEEEIPTTIPTPDAATSPNPDAATEPDTAPLPIEKPAALMVNTSFVDFGSIVFGTRASATAITVVNTGELSTGKISLALTGDPLGGFAFLDPSLCEGANLPSGGTCIVRIVAEPKQAVNAEGLLAITSASGAMASVSFAVTGIKPPQLAANVSQLTFKPAPIDATAETMPLVLRNAGDLDTGTATFSIKGPDAESFRIDAGSCNKPLPKDATCTANVTMVAAKMGSLVATIEATSSPGGTIIVDLVGTGLTAANGAKLVFTAPPLVGMQVNFDEQATGVCSRAIDFTITNQGLYASDPIALAFSGTDADDFVAVADFDACTGKRLPINGTCIVRINFCANNFGLHYATLTASARASISGAIDVYGYSY